jgi:hypothetical protein
MNAMQYDCHAKMHCLTPECYRGLPNSSKYWYEERLV